MAVANDIAIVGGGLVGLCAALVLQHPGRRVVLLEANQLGPAESTGLSARSIALSASSAQLFKAIGLWPQISAEAVPIQKIHISSRGRWGVARLNADDYQLDAVGYVVEHRFLIQCLLQAARASSQIQLLENAEFRSIQQQDQVRIEYASANASESGLAQVDAHLAVIADGAKSKARDALEIGSHSIDYAQTAIICNIEVSHPQHSTAYERFTSQGPLAMLPLGGKRYACVWTLAPEVGSQLSDQGDDQFNQALQQCFGMRLGYIERVGPRFAIPIERTRADRLQSKRSFLIGNAANALHPVAGQSFNLSLRDIAGLYQLLPNAALSELDDTRLGSITTDYQNERQKEHQRVIRYGDGLVTTFSNSVPLLDHARAVSLSMLDLMPALKTQVAFAGMGFAFGGNRLLRGRL